MRSLRRRHSSDFSTSFLDLCCCALGGLILLMVLLVPVPAPEQHTAPPQERRVEAKFRLATASRPRLRLFYCPMLYCGQLKLTAHVNNAPVPAIQDLSLTDSQDATDYPLPFGKLTLSIEKTQHNRYYTEFEVSLIVAIPSDREDAWPVSVDLKINREVQVDHSTQLKQIWDAMAESYDQLPPLSASAEPFVGWSVPRLSVSSEGEVLRRYQLLGGDIWRWQDRSFLSASIRIVGREGRAFDKWWPALKAALDRSAPGKWQGWPSPPSAAPSTPVRRRWPGVSLRTQANPQPKKTVFLPIRAHIDCALTEDDDENPVVKMKADWKLEPAEVES